MGRSSRWVLIALLGLGACDSVFELDRPQTGDAPAIDGPPPVCMRDPFDGAPTADDDGDTVPNQNDGCPKLPDPREEEHNEDGDCRGDRCDLCPHVAEPTGDADGDGVGDLCDFHDGTDKLFFEPFTNVDELLFLPTISRWTLTGASNQLRSTGSRSIAYSNDQTRQNGTFETVIELVDLDTFDTGLAFGIGDVALGGSGYALTISRMGGGPHQLRLYRLSTGSDMILADRDLGVLAPGGLYILRVTVDAMNLTVTLKSGATAVIFPTTIPMALPQLSFFGLVANVPANFGYLYRAETQ